MSAPAEPLVIVGGGLAGAASALRLAQAGLAPLLLEREREPVHKVCGEFLSWEAQAHLRALGLDVRDHACRDSRNNGARRSCRIRRLCCAIGL